MFPFFEPMIGFDFGYCNFRDVEWQLSDPINVLTKGTHLRQTMWQRSEIALVNLHPRASFTNIV